MSIIQKLFIAGYSAVIGLFFCCSIALVCFAVMELWHGINPTQTLDLRTRFNAILECIGLLTIAVVALELGQTILEEEVRREVHMSSPTRVRRFLSRFLVVIVVALGIETLVAVFEFAHDDTSKLTQAAAIGVAAGVILAAWGLFIRFNTSAEKLEPDELQRVKSEDKKVEGR
jgi:hypothetical protein